MSSGLRKANVVPMKKVAARLNILNSYPKQFLKPENASFSAGEIIGVVLGMITNAWCNIMAQAGTEPRETEFDKLITHLEILEYTTPEHNDSDGN